MLARLRVLIFWLHLAAGLTAGACIGIMCFTGTALAFEKDLVTWAERDARRVSPPAAEAPRLPLEDLAERVAAARPEARPSAITLSRDPRDAVVFTFGRDGAVYADPYSGEVRTPAGTRMHDLMHALEDWHRVLALGGDHRPIGKAINGACNAAFLFLAFSGLWLWWPRAWSWRGLRAVALVNWRLAGKARDFNWHNAIGLWCAPVLIVLTLTALPISYRWAGDLVYRLAGEQPPPSGPGAPAPGGAGRVEPARPAPDSPPLSRDRLLALAQAQYPAWESITFRLGGPPRAAPGTGAPSGREGEANRLRGEQIRHPAPVTLVIKEPEAWPRVATTSLTLNPFTGEPIKTETFADFSTGRQLRIWMRFLHTGEALGRPGQLVAGLASLGGCFLVFTGLALSWRRFFGSKPGPLSD